jgi:LCP family protein required for cell wall assembly
MPRDRDRSPYRAAHARRSRRAGRRPRRSWVERSVLGLGIVIVVLALGAGAVAAWLVRSLGEIDRYEELSVDGAPAGEPENYLVVGSDSRSAASDGEQGMVPGQRSDTIMVVRLDPATKHADMLSIPRDLWVPIAGTGDEARINSAYSQGRQVLLDTLRENFGIEINHYVEIDFQGFKQMVDAMDGVSIYLEDAIKDKASGLFVEDRGCVELDGEQALAFARSRHMQYMTPDGWSRPDPYADLGRMERQQVFIRRALTKALGNAKSNPLAFKDLLSIGVGSVGIDGETDPIDLARQFKDLDTDDLTTYSLPVLDSGDHATVVVDGPKAEPVLNVFRGLDPADLSPGMITVRVLNGTAAPGRAAEIADTFEGVGFEMSTPDNIEAHARTTVYHRPDEANFGNEVARYIAGGADVVAREDLDIQPGEVVVAIGDDFTGVSDEPAPVEDVEADATPTVDEEQAGTGTGAGAQSADDRPADDSSPALDEFTVGDPPPGIDCD